MVADSEINLDVLAQIRRVVFEAYANDFSEEDWQHTCGGWRVVVFDDGVFVRNSEALIRTEDEDDGLMVLRCGPSADIDLAARIVCERRSGDDW